MFTLYHYPLCPASRLIRILLHELEIEFVLERIDFWEKEQIAAKINPSGELPAIADRWGKTFCDLYAILEYLLELHQNSRFSCQDLGARAEMRRMISWVMLKMHQDSTKYILQERVVKRAKKISPQVDVIRTAKSNLLQHLMYLSRMIASRGYLAAEQIFGRHMQVLALARNQRYSWRELLHFCAIFYTIDLKNSSRTIILTALFFTIYYAFFDLDQDG